MGKRVCYNCENEIPPETEHFIINDEEYCTDCVKAKPYTAHTYYADGEYVGNSEDESVKHVDSFDDEYEEAKV